ncbi:hypothetical protein HUT18_15985 [Streptomyces sp. NA04227]|uniref:hypothetical protein n=1 Tax=Streptomyces sp. NA04227 TaxID=2742136 RepID=UPI001592070D|nr:hypothetical protein [Streptomyces sp. NA04227]QKW07655.1 hypothetical protein HUT18_15985 [Streptomyces sp. NA04227]
MAAPWHKVHVPEGLFGLLDDHEVPHYGADWSNGLIAPMRAGGAFINSGIHTGNVHARTKYLTTRPEDLDTSLDWDEIVEASVHAPRDGLRLESLDQGPADDGSPLAGHGATDYRVRVHAHGREIAWDKTASTPTETYLLLVWPAEPAPAQTLRFSGRLGQTQEAHDPHRLAPLDEPPTTPADVPIPRPN